MADVRIAVLGAFELHVAGRMVPVPSGRQRAVLTTLALDTRRVVPVESLIERVWGDRLPSHPRANVQTLVNRVRSAVGQDTIGTTPGGYRLDVPADAVDVLRFQRLVADAARQPTELARARLTDALRLWRGDPLADAGSESLLRERAPSLVEQYLGAVERRADLDLDDAGGDLAGLITGLTELTHRYPLREPLWARLMAALERAGRPAEALAAYHRIRGRLSDELGADPSPELRRSYARLLAAVDEGDAGTPAPARQPVVPRQLPPDAARFVGRAADLSILDDALGTQLDAGRPAIIVLHGPGGVGKTALAVRWAHRIAHHFPDGQLHVDLHGFGPGDPTDPAAALETVLSGLGVPAADVPRSRPERAALLRTELADRRVLLLLDNARDADQVRPLLPGTGSLVLVTSRNQLRGLAVRDGAHCATLREMPAGESANLVRQVIGDHRAAAEPAAVTALAELCGRLPLALVIAAEQAVRFPDTPLAGLVADLRASDARLDRLADPYDATTDPRTVFSWSYRHLDAGPARAFRLLSLHRGPQVSTEAAAALLGVDARATRRLLDMLVSTSLLGNDRPDRYRAHDLLGVYAAELADAGEAPDARRAAERRMLDWYLHTLWRARTAIFSAARVDPVKPASPVTPLTFEGVHDAGGWYREMRPTLLAMVEYAAANSYDDHCWRLAALLRPFHQLSHHVDDELRATALAVDAAERLDSDAARLSIWHERANALNDAGDHEQADRWYGRVLALGERLEDQHVVAATLSSMGVALTNRGRTADAIGILERSVAAARRTGHPLRLAHSLLNLVHAEGVAGLLDASDEHGTEALGIYRDQDAPYQQSLLLNNMAENALDRGDPAAAIGHVDEALRLLDDVDDATGAAGAMVIRGRALTMAGEPDLARRSLRDALSIMERTDDPAIAEVRRLLAATHAP